MEHLNIYEAKAMYALLITCAVSLIYVTWVLLVLLKGIGIWRWLDPKLKVEKKDYTELFLEREPDDKSAEVKVSKELYDKIEKYLVVISSDTDISSYIDSIISEHFKHYKKEINQLYRDKFKEPI